MTYRIPPDDTRERAVCEQCRSVHYQNPLLVVGTIPVWQDKVLLCRRAIEPRYGLWTLPAGFMENGETTGEGALRETHEEAGAQVELGEKFSLIDLPSVNQVHVFYLARLTSLQFDPGPESLEVALFAEDQIPWDDLAFRTVSVTLELFFTDHRQGRYGSHVRSLAPQTRY